VNHGSLSLQKPWNVRFGCLGKHDFLQLPNRVLRCVVFDAWKDYDIVAWNGVQWSLSAVFIVASFICAFQFPQYWWNEDPAFPRMRKAMWAMAFNLVSLILSALVYAVDPYRFNASTGGYLTLGYRAGMSVISNLSQSFVGVSSCS
jgi:hypothetical protein